LSREKIEVESKLYYSISCLFSNYSFYNPRQTADFFFILFWFTRIFFYHLAHSIAHTPNSQTRLRRPTLKSLNTEFTCLESTTLGNSSFTKKNNHSFLTRYSSSISSTFALSLTQINHSLAYKNHVKKWKRRWRSFRRNSGSTTSTSSLERRFQRFLLIIILEWKQIDKRLIRRSSATVSSTRSTIFKRTNFAYTKNLHLHSQPKV